LEILTKLSENVWQFRTRRTYNKEQHGDNKKAGCSYYSIGLKEKFNMELAPSMGVSRGSHSCQNSVRREKSAVGILFCGVNFCIAN